MKGKINYVKEKKQTTQGALKQFKIGDYLKVEEQ